MEARARRAEATAERILDVSRELFQTHRYEEVTLARVAEAAGVTVPTLIAHFGRKEQLFAAASEAEIRRMIAARDEAPAGDPPGAIRNLIDHYEADGRLLLHALDAENRVASVRAVTEVGRDYHREWVERVFEPNLRSIWDERRERLTIQLVVATDLLAWKLMRLDMKLSRARVEAAILATVEALIGDG
jgi:AcrR family transcriptional regulator